MSVLLEDRIKEAILAVRWKQAGDGPNPNYFESATKDSCRFEISTASFLAGFITNHINANTYQGQDDSEHGELEKYSLEAMASYLEDNGYTVSLPE